MLLSSRTPAQTSNILLIGTLRTFAHMKKLFLMCALISPNPEKCAHMSRRKVVETGDMVCYPSTGN